MHSKTTKKVRSLLLHQKQADFVSSSANISALLGGRGVGKTFSGAVKILTQAKNGEPWMSVSPDSGIILDTTLPTFIEICRHYKKLIRYVRSPYARVWFKTQDGGEANLIMRSGEAPEKLRGPNKAGLWLDEASIMSRDVFDIGIATLRIKNAANQVFLTMTPRGIHHWTFSLFYQLVDEYEQLQIDPARLVQISGQTYMTRDNTEIIRAASYENPFLPDGYADRLRAEYSEEFAQQEIEGNFIDLSGLMFNRSDFQFIDAIQVPRLGTRVRYWDQASTPGSGDFSVGLLMCRDASGRFIIESIVRGQWSAKERRDIMKRTAAVDAEKYNNEVVIYVEQEPGSGGKEQMDQNVTWLAGYPVYRDKVAGSGKRKVQGVMLPNQAKVVRAQPLSAMAENENIYLVRGKWNERFLGELSSFPESRHDDQVDAASGAFNKLAQRSSSRVSPELQKVNQLQSHAARILQMAEDSRLQQLSELGNAAKNKPANSPERLKRGLDDSARGGSHVV